MFQELFAMWECKSTTYKALLLLHYGIPSFLSFTIDSFLSYASNIMLDLIQWIPQLVSLCPLQLNSLKVQSLGTAKGNNAPLPSPTSCGCFELLQKLIVFKFHFVFHVMMYRHFALFFVKITVVELKV